MSHFPIDAVLAPLRQALQNHNRCLLQADPGAGKTTRVPPALLQEPWLAGQKIIMLEPRRLAARNASQFMARQRGEQPGQTIGHRTRLETRVGPATRIEVVTEGVLARLLQQDPELRGVGCVILDEHHERNLHSDLALALLLECQQVLREDLRLLLMSATLDSAPLLQLLGEDTPLIQSAGRCFPVTTRYLGGRPEPRDPASMAATLADICRRETGSLLCFLPGSGEIRRLQRALAQQPLPADLAVLPLHGALPAAEQERAIAPAAAGRKLVLTTAIAETSLTIDGVRVVIDGGLMRLPRFDPQRGMSRLVTLPVSQASAEQRRGRAGRLEPGVCYRFWSEESQALLPSHRPPELLSADLSGLRLELAQWGSTAAQLSWLDPPPAAHLAQAEMLLQQLGALDPARQLTERGRGMLELGAHPRLAAMMLQGQQLGYGALACDLAALLSERDTGPYPGSDLGLRLERLRQGRGGPLQSVRQNARRWCQRLRARPREDDLDAAGLLLSYAFPDRIAQRRGDGSTQYLLSNGAGAQLDAADPLRNQPYLVAAELDGQRSGARIYLAASLTLEQLEQHQSARITSEQQLVWDDTEARVQCRWQQRLGALVLRQRAERHGDGAAVAAVLLQGIRRRGSQALPWNDHSRALQARVALLRRRQPQHWPDLSDAALMATLEQWLLPYLDGCWRLDQLARVDLGACLTARLDWERQQQLERLAPTHFCVPSGSRIRIDYGRREQPVLAVKLQELFGLATTPCICAGQQPLLLELLSPAQRPIQTTSDLAGFWANTYVDVKKDLKGRYPKHPWPDDPLTAVATRFTKRRPPA